jgi:co-chaperonin GroES (HSP10)|tara:strand:+ start:1779 stop:2369 length:591 start_codon:yes stop_codon:yes gene_type:complete
MKTLDLFVVELEKQLNDTMTTESGLELYVDTRFNEFEHRVTEGPVVSPPIKHNTGVEPGDTLYFHHLVVLNEGQALTGHENHYLVRYDPDHTINNQAIGYKSSKSGHIHPLAGWALLEPVEQEELKTKSDVIEVVELKKALPTKGRVAFEAPWLEELGLKEGDVVGFKQNRDYRIKIDDKEYYRTRKEDLLYVEHE